MRFAQKFELMGARRPAAAGEPARENVREDCGPLENGHQTEVTAACGAVEACATTTRPSTGTPFSLRTETSERDARASPASVERAADVRLAVGIAQCRQKLHAVARMGFDREGKKTARRKHARDRRQDRAQIVDINEHVGGEHEMIFRGIAGLAAKKVHKVGGDEAVINAFRFGLRDHCRRKIDADQPIDEGAKSGASKSGAAAEIERGRKAQWPCRRVHRLFDRVAQQRRPAIGELLGQRRVVARGVLVEQPADVRFAHRRGGVAAPEPGKLQPGAVIIVRVGVAGLFECRDSAGAVAEPVADGAEREPGGGESRREFDGLREDIGGTGKDRRARHDRAPICSAGRR